MKLSIRLLLEVIKIYKNIRNIIIKLESSNSTSIIFYHGFYILKNLNNKIRKSLNIIYKL